MVTINMVWLKSCPKCRGDQIHQSDIYGPYIKCLQCGHIIEEVANDNHHKSNESQTRNS